MSVIEKLEGILQKRRTERAQQSVVEKIAPLAPERPPTPEFIRKIRAAREEAKKPAPVTQQDRDSLTQFAEDQQKAVKYKASLKKESAPRDIDDWSFTVRSGVVLMIAAVTYIITIASVRL
jgi:hypothetical protein